MLDFYNSSEYEYVMTGLEDCIKSEEERLRNLIAEINSMAVSKEEKSEMLHNITKTLDNVRVVREEDLNRYYDELSKVNDSLSEFIRSNFCPEKNSFYGGW